MATEMISAFNVGRQEGLEDPKVAERSTIDAASVGRWTRSLTLRESRAIEQRLMPLYERVSLLASGGTL